MLKSRRDFIDTTTKAVGLTLLSGVSALSCKKTATDTPSSNPNPILLRFATASDGHYGYDGVDYKKQFNTLVTALNNEKRVKGLDLCIINGDIVNNRVDLLGEAKTALDNLNCPYYVTKGNHDTTTDDNWEKIWKIPVNYSFKQKNCGFVLVTTSNENGDYLCPNPAYLQQTLGGLTDMENIFIFMHITPNNWTTYGIDCKQVRNSINNTPNVRAIFNGHDHQEDGIKYYEGNPYLFSGHFGANWGVSYYGYRIVEVYKNNTVKTYTVDPVTNMPINIIPI